MNGIESLRAASHFRGRPRSGGDTNALGRHRKAPTESLPRTFHGSIDFPGCSIFCTGIFGSLSADSRARDPDPASFHVSSIRSLWRILTAWPHRPRQVRRASHGTTASNSGQLRGALPRGAFMVGEIEPVAKRSEESQRQGQDLGSTPTGQYTPLFDFLMEHCEKAAITLSFEGIESGLPSRAREFGIGWWLTTRRRRKPEAGWPHLGSLISPEMATLRWSQPTWSSEAAETTTFTSHVCRWSTHVAASTTPHRSTFGLARSPTAGRNPRRLRDPIRRGHGHQGPAHRRETLGSEGS